MFHQHDFIVLVIRLQTTRDGHVENVLHVAANNMRPARVATNEA